jgi:hypothetical protein
MPGRFVCRPAQQPWSATSDLLIST